MGELIKKHRLSFILVIVGAVGGYLYWRFVGCISGGCPITSNWIYTTLFGALIGYFIADSINDRIKQKTSA